MYALEVEIDGEKEDESEREVRKCLRKIKSKGERGSERTMRKQAEKVEYTLTFSGVFSSRLCLPPIADCNIYFSNRFRTTQLEMLSAKFFSPTSKLFFCIHIDPSEAFLLT